MFVEGLDHVQVAAPRDCEAEARRFFGELLELVEVDKPEPLRAVRRFYSEDPWGNRIELLASG